MVKKIFITLGSILMLSTFIVGGIKLTKVTEEKFLDFEEVYILKEEGEISLDTYNNFVCGKCDIVSVKSALAVKYIEKEKAC